MKDEPIIGHITPADGNVFLDLGFSPEQAAMMKADSDREILEKRMIKESLRGEVTGWIEANHLKQDEAARILNVTRPRVSDIVNGKLAKFSIDALVNMVIRTGKSVSVVAS